MLSDYISKQDRIACMKAGALAYAGMLDAELGPLPQVKEAGVIDMLREEELKEKIRLDRTAADEMASGLSGGEV